jgi:hypothetical protein
MGPFAADAATAAKVALRARRRIALGVQEVTAGTEVHDSDL